MKTDVPAKLCAPPETDAPKKPKKTRSKVERQSGDRAKKHRTHGAKSLWFAVPFILFAGAILAFPDRYVAACFRGFGIWAESVLPSLFPFMVVTTILIKTGVAERVSRPFSRICGRLHLPRAAVPLFAMSVCSGYPAGSRMLYEYYSDGSIGKEDCKRLAPLCSTAGPLFITGTVGYKAFGGGSTGLKLLCACLISVVTTSLVYSLFSKPAKDGEKISAPPDRGADALYDSFYGSVVAVCVAGGFIAFFYTMSQALADFGVLTPFRYALAPLFGEDTATALLTGLCEATNGCFALAEAGGFFALPLAGFLVTFGGASILLQQTCYLNKCGVRAAFFVAFKFVQGAVTFALLCLFSLW